MTIRRRRRGSSVTRARQARNCSRNSRRKARRRPLPKVCAGPFQRGTAWPAGLRLPAVVALLSVSRGVPVAAPQHAAARCMYRIAAPQLAAPPAACCGATSPLPHSTDSRHAVHLSAPPAQPHTHSQLAAHLSWASAGLPRNDATRNTDSRHNRRKRAHAGEEGEEDSDGAAPASLPPQNASTGDDAGAAAAGAAAADAKTAAGDADAEMVDAPASAADAAAAEAREAAADGGQAGQAPAASQPTQQRQAKAQRGGKRRRLVGGKSQWAGLAPGERPWEGQDIMAFTPESHPFHGITRERLGVQWQRQRQLRAGLFLVSAPAGCGGAHGMACSDDTRSAGVQCASGRPAIGRQCCRCPPTPRVSYRLAALPRRRHPPAQADRCPDERQASGRLRGRGRTVSLGCCSPCSHVCLLALRLRAAPRQRLALPRCLSVCAVRPCDHGSQQPWTSVLISSPQPFLLQAPARQVQQRARHPQCVLSLRHQWAGPKPSRQSQSRLANPSPCLCSGSRTVRFTMCRSPAESAVCWDLAVMWRAIQVGRTHSCLLRSGGGVCVGCGVGGVGGGGWGGWVGVGGGGGCGGGGGGAQSLSTAVVPPFAAWLAVQPENAAAALPPPPHPCLPCSAPQPGVCSPPPPPPSLSCLPCSTTMIPPPWTAGWRPKSASTSASLAMRRCCRGCAPSPAAQTCRWEGGARGRVGADVGTGGTAVFPPACPAFSAPLPACRRF